MKGPSTSRKSVNSGSIQPRPKVYKTHENLLTCLSLKFKNPKIENAYAQDMEQLKQQLISWFPLAFTVFPLTTSLYSFLVLQNEFFGYLKL